MIRQNLPRRLNNFLRSNGTDRDFVTGIGGSEQEAARAVGCDVSHAIGERAAANIFELAAFRVNRKTGYPLWLAARRHIEETAIRADRHRRRASGFDNAGDRYRFDQPQLACLLIELQNVNVVAFSIADINECRGRRRRNQNSACDCSRGGERNPEQLMKYLLHYCFQPNCSSPCRREEVESSVMACASPTEAAPIDGSILAMRRLAI